APSCAIPSPASTIFRSAAAAPVATRPAMWGAERSGCSRARTCSPAGAAIWVKLLTVLPWLGGLTRYVVVGALATSRAAWGQAATDGFGIERFQLPTSNASLLDVDWADVPGHLSWGAGLWVGFAHDPLVLYDQSMARVDTLVGRRVTTGLVGSLGLTDRFEL